MSAELTGLIPHPPTPAGPIPAPRATPPTVIIHRHFDGTVTAMSRGRTGIGRTPLEALTDLDRQLEAGSPPPAR